MQRFSETYSPILTIEKLLDEVFEDISMLTEENFDQKFISAKHKMKSAMEIKAQNNSKFAIFESSKKIMQMAKLISDKYDNIIKDWADRLKSVQKEIELTQNQKKITIYKR